MGSYICSLQKKRTLNLKMVDGSTASVAQTKYLCRLGQLHQTEWTEKGDKLAHPELMRAVNRIQDNLGDFTADYINICQDPYKKSEMDGAYLRKVQDSVRPCYNDDFPNGVSKETYMAIKLKEGFVILELNHQKNFNFIQATPELWEKRLENPFHVRINKNYTASVYSLKSLYDYLVGDGKDQVDGSIRSVKETDAPQWFINMIDFMVIHERARVK